MYFLADGERPLVCKEGVDNPARCESSERWVQAIIILTRDLFGGSQHILMDSNRGNSE
jgi:hypothetical protein